MNYQIQVIVIKCPMNEEIQGESSLPCGQFHCWVNIHCERDESE